MGTFRTMDLRFRGVSRLFANPETLLHSTSSITHDAGMGTAGERVPGEAMAHTGVAP